MASSSSRNKFASEIADQAVVEWPNTPTKQLARMMMKRHRHVFSTLNAAMCAIRYRRGAMGNKMRKRKGVAGIAVTPPSASNAINPLCLPESSAKGHDPFVMDGVGRCLILPDLHLPYHDLQALTVMLQDGLRNECDGVLINGDLLDFHTLSQFVKDPAARKFPEERVVAKQFLARLRELFPKARIVFKEGNHDERLQNFVMEKAPELYDETIFGLDSLLGLEALGIEHVKEKREVMLGKLFVLHGHELPRGISAPVNPARGAFLRAKVSVLVSHSHRTSEHTETPMDRSIVSAWSTGCGCFLRPQFEPNNSWNHGHAIVEVASDGQFHVRNVRIHEGEMLN